MDVSTMDSLTESEIAAVASLQRDAGVQRLSAHFSWPEFCDERRRFHQEFVYDVAVFAADRGFPRPAVIRAAAVARGLFPQLGGLDACGLSSLLRDVLRERLPNLTPVHRHEFTRYLADTWVTRRRLLRAVVGGDKDVSVTQLHLEVQLPPPPCPLAQGTYQQKRETRQPQARLGSTLQKKEEELRCLRAGPRVAVEEICVPEDSPQKSLLDLVRAAVKATEEQIQASLNREVALLRDILQLKLQEAASAKGRRQNTTTTSDTGKTSRLTGPSAKAKPQSKP
ncbi:uncharacterized protein C8orf74 homolog [Brachyistius frenatus]|uniref:uncharacterized protein C8orf74 homolog n=1 Tax=Brachyistius frenatus TaxID=100188 RepID=UPI0037E9984A